MVMSTRCRMRLLVAEENAMSPLRGHKEVAPDDSTLKDPKGKPVKDEPVSEPVLVDEPVVEEPPAESTP
jgi:hypothetical protein